MMKFTQKLVLGAVLLATAAPSAFAQERGRGEGRRERPAAVEGQTPDRGQRGEGRGGGQRGMGRGGGDFQRQPRAEMPRAPQTQAVQAQTPQGERQRGGRNPGRIEGDRSGFQRQDRGARPGFQRQDGGDRSGFQRGDRDRPGFTGDGRRDGRPEYRRDDRQNVRPDYRRDDRNWSRGDRRDDRRWDGRNFGHRSPQRFRAPRYRPPVGFYARSWGYGDFLPRGWYGLDYRISDWSTYGLPQPPIGFYWVRVGSDVLLVDRFTGEVVEVIHEIFW